MNRAEWEADVQGFEADWWGDCANTLGEELKQVRAYAPVMGMAPRPWRGGNHWPVWNLDGKSVLDVGGGPVSMLLKCVNVGEGSTVLDPCAYPAWTTERYAVHGVRVVSMPAEDFDGQDFDEAWLYNVLAHTLDPEAIVRMMRRAANTAHVFEWVDIPAHPGHPQELKADKLADWLGVTDAPKYHHWYDEQYVEVSEGDPSAVAHAWGGVFA